MYLSVLIFNICACFSACPEKHPSFFWLPTKLAEWIGENLQDELVFTDKVDKSAEPGTGWTPAELNHILQAHVVDGALTTFGCVDWSQICAGASCVQDVVHLICQNNAFME
jgi:hypothetical protein